MPEVVSGHRRPRLRRPGSTRRGPRPAPADPAGRRAAPRGCTGRRCARLRRPGSTRRGPRPALADPAGASSRPRWYWASVCPASAARVHQMRASASSGGSSLVASSSPRWYWASVCPGFGGLGPPGAGLGQLRRFQPGGEQPPEAVLGAVCPASAARVHQVRASASSGGSSRWRAASRGGTGLGVSRLRRPGSTRRGPRPAPAGPAWSASSRPRLYWAPVSPASRPWSTRRGPRPAPAGPARCEQYPQAYWALAVPGFGGLGPPGAGLGQLRRVQLMASRTPRPYWASLCPASAALVHQARASASSGGSSWSASSRPEAVLGLGVPGFGGPGPPGAGLGQLRRVQLVCEQHPEVVLGVGLPGFGGHGPPGAGAGQVRRVQPRGEQYPEGDWATVCPASAALVHQVRARPGPAGPAWWRAGPRGRSGHRCARPRRPDGSPPPRPGCCRAGRQRRQCRTRPRPWHGPESAARWFRPLAGPARRPDRRRRQPDSRMLRIRGTGQASRWVRSRAT